MIDWLPSFCFTVSQPVNELRTLRQRQFTNELACGLQASDRPLSQAPERQWNVSASISNVFYYAVMQNYGKWGFTNSCLSFSLSGSELQTFVVQSWSHLLVHPHLSGQPWPCRRPSMDPSNYWWERDFKINLTLEFVILTSLVLASVLVTHWRFCVFSRIPLWSSRW